MGYQDDRGTAVADGLDKIPGDAAGGGVKAGGHFIQEYDFRIVDQRQSD